MVEITSDPKQPEEPLQDKVFVNGEEVPQLPSTAVPDNIADSLREMNRVTRESEEAQEKSKFVGE